MPVGDGVTSPPLPFRDRRSIPVAVALMGVAASALFSFLVFPALRGPLDLNLDPDRCAVLARNIGAGRGYVYTAGGAPAVDRGPAYPYFLAALEGTTGSASPAVVQAAQAVLHGATTLMVFAMVLAVADRRSAVLAQVLTAFHPVLLWYAARIWTETFFTFLVTGAVLASVMLLRRPGAAWAAAGGLLAGLAALTKAIFLPWGVLAGVMLVARQGRGALRRALLFALLPVAMVLPWTLRNHAATEAFVPVHTLLGANMINGDAVRDHWSAHPGSSSAIYARAEERRAELLAGTGLTMSDPDGDRLLLGASLRDNTDHPLRFVRRTLLNGLTFWYLGESPVKSLFLALMQLPLAAAVVFVVSRRRARSELLPLLAVILLFWLAHALVNGWARYSAPVLPAGMAVAGWMWFDRRRRMGAVVFVESSRSIA